MPVIFDRVLVLIVLFEMNLSVGVNGSVHLELTNIVLAFSFKEASLHLEFFENHGMVLVELIVGTSPNISILLTMAYCDNRWRWI